MPTLATFSMLGHGPTVLMLHGSGGSFRSFAPQVEVLASLGFRGVSWNMPGYAHSVPVEPYSFMGLAASCAYLIETLMAEAQQRSVALVGHGMGGMLALEMAMRRPDLVRQLVLVATATAVLPGDGYDRHIVQGLRWLDEAQDMQTTADTLLPRLVSPGALPEGVRLATFCQSQVHAATWRRALEAMRGFDRRAALGHIAAPTLVVAGEHDRVAPPETLSALAHAIPGAELATLPAAGHLPHLEQPDAFDEALVHFLQTARRLAH
jgi:pimeloyl-ACP methyl ester carboxylesterase